MNKMSLFVALSVASLAVSAPASAVVFTFATFAPASSASNVRWDNSGNSASRSNDASFYTTTTATSTTPGTVAVRFSFLDALLAPYVSDVVANYTLNATVAKNSPATTVGSVLIQNGLSGSFSFLSTSAITVSGPGLATTFYAPGSNLLSGVFTGGQVLGTVNGTSGASFASGVQGTGFSFTSDFLSFESDAGLDRAISLTAISPALRVGSNGALRSFRAVSGGQFSADPSPDVNAAVPEPATWAMMLAGFGMIGFGLRRRLKQAVRFTYA